MKRQVRQFISTNFHLNGSALPSDDAPLLTSGLIDSAGVLELILFLESEFGIVVDEEEVVPKNLDTIDLIATFVEGKQPASPHETELSSVR